VDEKEKSGSGREVSVAFQSYCERRGGMQSDPTGTSEQKETAQNGSRRPESREMGKLEATDALEPSKKKKNTPGDRELGGNQTSDS